MKAYVATTGILFALVTLVHVWRCVEEGSHVAADPWFLGATAIAAALSVWAFRLYRLAARSGDA